MYFITSKASKKALEERLDPRERQLAAPPPPARQYAYFGTRNASKLPTCRVTCWLPSAHSLASAAKCRRARVHPAAALAAVHRGGRVQASTLVLVKASTFSTSKRRTRVHPAATLAAAYRGGRMTRDAD